MSGTARIQKYLDALVSGDTNQQVNALQQLAAMKPGEDWLPPLEQALKTCADDLIRFQLQKTRDLVLIKLGKMAAPPGGLAGLETLLAQNPPDPLLVALVLETLPVGEAAMATDLLRERRWAEMPSPLLPSLCRFFKQHGSIVDSEALCELCRHHNPKVLAAALDALEALDPTHLPGLVTPLLANADPGIRMRAIRCLYKWDKSEAMIQMQRLLTSTAIADRKSALLNSFFFPYAEIEPALLRYLSEETDAKMLEMVSLIFRTNPHPDLPFRLYWICKSLKGEHRETVRKLLLAVVQSLEIAGLIDCTPQEFLDRLKARVKAEELQRLAAVATGPVPAVPATAPAATPQAPATAVPSAPAPMVPVAVVSGLDATTIGRMRLDLPRQLRTLKGAELAALIQGLATNGTAEDAELVRPMLGSENSSVVVAAIAVLMRFDPEYLAVYLPQLIQHADESVRAQAVAAFCEIDREQIRSLISSLLAATQTRQRFLGTSAAVLVDFSLVREAVLAAISREQVPDLVERLGVPILANPDRELFRRVFRAWRQAGMSCKEQYNVLTQQLAERLAQALGGITTAAELLKDEDAALAAEADAAVAAAAVATAKPRDRDKSAGASGAATAGAAGKSGRVAAKTEATVEAEARDTRSNVTMVVFGLAAVLWALMLGYLVIHSAF